MEQVLKVLCQASQRDLRDEDIGQGSAKANKFVYVTIEQAGGATSHQLSALFQPMGGLLVIPD